MKPPAARRRVLPGSPFKEEPAPAPGEVFSLHDRVNHDRYGVGMVTGLEGDSAVLVDFGSGVYRIALPTTKLIKL
jgi:hypothetical protein